MTQPHTATGITPAVSASEAWRASHEQSRLGMASFALLLVILIAVVVAVFQPALSGPFIFDDFPNLENLRQLNSGVSRETIGHYLAAVHGAPARPLAMLSFLIEDAAWPTDPHPYKQNNLYFHLIAGLLVCWLAFRLGAYLRLSSNARLLVALFCMAAWLLTPSQLSATMLVVQRMNILATIFVLSGLILYLGVLERRSLPPFFRVAAAGVTLGLFGMVAFLCKENGVLIFAFASVLNATLLRKLLEELPRASRALLIAGTAAPLILLALYFALRWEWLQSIYLIRDFTPWERLLSQPRALSEYVANILVPRIGGQGILHDDFVVSRSLFDPASTLPALAFWILTAGAGIALRRRAPLFSFMILWYLAGHLLESTIIPLELYFEHRNYVAMIGFLIAIPAALARAPALMKRILSVGLAGWLAASAALTHLNAETWGNRGVQSLVWLNEHPKSRRAIQWAAAYHLDGGDLALARRTLVEGIQRLPNETDLRLQLVLLDCITQGVEARQWTENVELIRTAPYSHLPNGVFRSYVEQALGPRCHGTLSDPMLLAFAQAIISNPAYQAVPASLSGIHYELAKMNAVRGNLDDLIDHLDEAHRLDPQPTFPREAAIHLLHAGEADRALGYLDASDATPQPWLKKWLADPVRLNAPLRSAAERIQAAHERARNGAKQPSARGSASPPTTIEEDTPAEHPPSMRDTNSR